MCSASTSANVRIDADATPASSWSRPSTLSESPRSAAVHEGSSPTTGTPSSSHGRIRSRLRAMTRRAAPSCPVVTQVRPQQTAASGSSTR